MLEVGTTVDLEDDLAAVELDVVSTTRSPGLAQIPLAVTMSR